MSADQSKYWLDQAADEIIRRIPTGEVVVSSGISPSASYHIGHYREIMTAEALAWAVRQRGRDARHVHVVDNFDPMRKRYDWLPQEYEQYVGWPVSLVPDPEGCHDSYANHYFSEFQQYLKPMGLEPEIVLSYEQLYVPGRMTRYIELAIEHTVEIKKVFERLSNRSLPSNWTPVQVLGENKIFEQGDLSTWDKAAKTLNGRSYDNGGAKLNWRLDWPARWAELKVDVEPFGAQEHGAAGGSYDTGREFARSVFGIDAPYDAARYGHIHRPGENIKMSSSKGNVVTPGEALDVMPAEVLRYFIVRSRPERKIFFDPGAGLYNLIDEFAAAQEDPDHEFRDAYNFAVAGGTERVISSVPFKHLVQVYQAAQGNPDKAREVLARTGYAKAAKAEADILDHEFKFVKNWLNKYAPEDVKFEVQQPMPENVSLTDGQRAFLTILATTIDDYAGDLDGEAMHKIIYAAKEQADIPAKDSFQAIYRVILGKDSGPKAGWFLASLERDWLVKRLNLKA